VPLWALEACVIDLSLVIYKKEVLSAPEWKNLFNTLCFKCPNFMHVYTKGSKNDHLGTLAAAFAKNKSIKYGFKNET
jgi:hypothetical protein